MALEEDIAEAICKFLILPFKIITFPFRLFITIYAEIIATFFDVLLGKL